MASLSRLPADILSNILKDATLEDIASVAQVSQELYVAVKTNRFLWTNTPDHKRLSLPTGQKKFTVPADLLLPLALRYFSIKRAFRDAVFPIKRYSLVGEPMERSKLGCLLHLPIPGGRWSMYQRGRNLYLHDHDKSRPHINVENPKNGLRVDMDIHTYVASPMFEALGGGVVRCLHMAGDREGYSSVATSSETPQGILKVFDLNFSQLEKVVVEDPHQVQNPITCHPPLKVSGFDELQDTKGSLIVSIRDRYLAVADYSTRSGVVAEITGPFALNTHYSINMA
ncbi:hypothetical protein SISSUDRAFT_1132729, partial [Sistotremastrum suecicum HHB10207 ss-3]